MKGCPQSNSMSNCVVSAEQMKSFEDRFVKQAGVSIEQLMDRAGKSIADVITNQLGKGTILFLCGKGNNGGDGITAARFLNDYNTQVIVTGKKEDLSPASKNALSNYKRNVIFQPGITIAEDLIKKADLVVDCLFGFGFKGKIEGILGNIVEAINSSGKKIISADIPSGVEATTGKINGPAIKADQTITFSCAKLGHFLPPGAFNTKELIVKDIGINTPPDELNTFFTDLNKARSLMPPRQRDINKKSAGSVLVIGGSEQYSGAVVMAASSAILRAGAGYVTIACPENIADIVKEKVTEPIVKPLPSKNGSLSIDALGELLEIAKINTSTLIGPGISLNPETIELTQKFISKNEGLTVIDADAITALSLNKEIRLTKKNLLTPHSGEFSRLISKSAEEIEEERFPIATDFAIKHKTNLLLKGPFSIITDGLKTYFNTTGNTGLATAGTGDILSGLIAGFAAQSEDIYSSAVLGAYVHGLAADMAIKELTEYSLVATDLLSWIPKAIKQILDTGR